MDDFFNQLGTDSEFLSLALRASKKQQQKTDQKQTNNSRNAFVIIYSTHLSAESFSGNMPVGHQ